MGHSNELEWPCDLVRLKRDNLSWSMQPRVEWGHSWCNGPPTLVHKSSHVSPRKKRQNKQRQTVHSTLFYIRTKTWWKEWRKSRMAPVSPWSMTQLEKTHFRSNSNLHMFNTHWKTLKSCFAFNLLFSSLHIHGPLAHLSRSVSKPISGHSLNVTHLEINWRHE